MSTRPENYLRDWRIILHEALTSQGSHVMFSDYTGIQFRARAAGLCNWGMLNDRYLPLGFGAAFVQGSPYKTFIDNM